MSKNNQDNDLLNDLLRASNIYTKKSLFEQRAYPNANRPIIQYHINALINELMPLIKDDIDVLSLKNLGVGKLFKKPNKSSNAKNVPTLKVNARVPNIKVNTDFSECISLDKEVHGKIDFCWTESIDQFAGLAFDTESYTLSGTTDQVGDHQFNLAGFLSLANGQRQRILVELKVTFVADPRSLWKNIPSDETARFHKPDLFHSYCENKNMLLMGSSVRGRSHAHKGIHRDDDFKLFCDNSSEWIISCVADGAGSCKYSRQGAYVAADIATRVLKEALKGHYGNILERAYQNYYVEKKEEDKSLLLEAYQHTMVKAVYEAVKAIHNCVDSERGDSVKDFSTTLILAAHKKVEDGYLVISFWIGDGGVVIYDKNKKVTLMGDPDSGEFAGQTRFLDNRILENSSVYTRVRMEKVDSMSALILATDGITDAWFETEKQLESLSHWDKLWEELEPHVMNKNREDGLQGLTDWMSFWSKGNHDDRTISICLVKE